MMTKTRILLPFITKNNQTPIQGQAELSPRAAELFSLIRDHPDQKRTKMDLHPILIQAAENHAEDMGKRNFFGHVNPDGHGPNWRVRKLGYRLPDFYDQSDGGNSIESICAGFKTAKLALDALVNSPSHVVHILGLDHFYQKQTNLGVGYFLLPNGASKYWWYWCVVSSEPQKRKGEYDKTWQADYPKAEAAAGDCDWRCQEVYLL